MPDPVPLLRAFGASAAVAAVVVLLFGLPWRSPNPTRRALGEVLGVAAALYLGGWLLELNLRWPPRTAEGRYLLVLLPAVVVVEIVGAIPKVSHWVTWVLRLAIAAGAARLLLHNSSYLVDLSGTGSPEWSPI